MCERFKRELGYGFAEPFPIFEAGEGSRTMYYMIHASDHERALRLMAEAYRKVPSRREARQNLELPFTF